MKSEIKVLIFSLYRHTIRIERTNNQNHHFSSQMVLCHQILRLELELETDKDNISIGTKLVRWNSNPNEILLS